MYVWLQKHTCTKHRLIKHCIHVCMFLCCTCACVCMSDSRNIHVRNIDSSSIAYMYVCFYVVHVRVYLCLWIVHVCMYHQALQQNCTNMYMHIHGAHINVHTYVKALKTSKMEHFIFKYIYIYIYIYIYTRALKTYMHIYIHTYIHIYIHTHIHTYGAFWFV